MEASAAIMTSSACASPAKILDAQELLISALRFREGACGGRGRRWISKYVLVIAVRTLLYFEIDVNFTDQLNPHSLTVVRTPLSRRPPPCFSLSAHSPCPSPARSPTLGEQCVYCKSQGN
jgi:hypothetical protein